MAKKKKNGFDTKALEKYAERLEAAGGTAAIKRATSAAMIQAKLTINQEILKAIQASNLPAHGKYSQGGTRDSLSRSTSVDWSGNIAELPLGFNLSEDITSIFLMYGTPKMPPVNGLYAAMYGPAAQRTAKKKQDEAVKTILERLGG